MVKTKQRRSIWTYVLLGAFGVVSAMAVLLIAGAILLPRAIDRTIQKYTDTAPQAGPAVAITDREYATVKDRVDAFAKAVDSGAHHEPLILTSDELAAIVQRELQRELNRKGQDPRVQLWLRIDGDRLKGPVSIRMDDLAVGWFDGLRGRYLNGVATMDVWHADNRIRVRVDDFTIDGEPLPGWIMDALQQAVDDAMADSRELRELGRKLGGIEVQDGKVVVRSRGTK